MRLWTHRKILGADFNDEVKNKIEVLFDNLTVDIVSAANIPWIVAVICCHIWDQNTKFITYFHNNLADDIVYLIELL
mgnify:CR=1 FL=1